MALHSTTGVFRLLDQVSELTSVRDGNALNVALANILLRMSGVESATLLRAVGTSEELRWLSTVHCTPERVGTMDASACEFDQLPLIGEYPLRCRALQGEETFYHDDSLYLSVLPLGSGRNTGGVVELRGRRAIEPETLELLRRVLRLYQNHHALLNYGASDTLTGLLNRKTFDDSFREVTAVWTELPGEQFPGERRQVARQPFWLAMIDVDRFKLVNDTYGHLIGDEVLLTLSQLMRRTFRALDRLYRFGGEEFAAMIRCRNDVDASRIFERLRRTVEAHDFPQVGRITVSVGFTAIDPMETASSVIERADKAVYYAKQHGRNQVRCYEALLAHGNVTIEAKAGPIELF